MCGVGCTAYLNQTHQALRHGCLIPVRQVLFQGEDDAVGADGGQDQVLERSEGLRSRIKRGRETQRARRREGEKERANGEERLPGS